MPSNVSGGTSGYIRLKTIKEVASPSLVMALGSRIMMVGNAQTTRSAHGTFHIGVGRPSRQRRLEVNKSEARSLAIALLAIFPDLVCAVRKPKKGRTCSKISPSQSVAS